MPNSEDHSQQELIKFLKASLLLQLRNPADDKTEDEKPEVLLHRAGFSNKEIGNLLGKNPEAVKMVISRARKGAKGNKG